MPGPTRQGNLIINSIASRPTDRSRLLSLVQTSLEGDKASDIVVIDLTGKTTIADYMVIATGSSNRQIGAMADHLRERLKAEGAARLSVEGAAQCDWVLIDAGDIVVHLFRPEVRAFYALEKMWGAQQFRAGATA